MHTGRFDGPVELPSGPFRRYATRYEPMRRDACLAWWGSTPSAYRDETEAGPVAHHHYALLLDISHSGASLALDRVPEEEGDVWLRLDDDHSENWTEATVVGVTTTARGPHLVRLAFRGPCPFDTLRSAVCG